MERPDRFDDPADESCMSRTADVVLVVFLALVMAWLFSMTQPAYAVYQGETTPSAHTLVAPR